MLDELKKYIQNDHFLFRLHDSLTIACNAPTDKSGVYIVYALKKGSIELIYIGRSGKRNHDGSMFIRKTGLGGIKDRIVNGHQFGKIPRRISWPEQMRTEGIDELDIYWYITHNQNFIDCPREIEKSIISKYLHNFGRLPKWNNEI